MKTEAIVFVSVALVMQSIVWQSLHVIERQRDRETETELSNMIAKEDERKLSRLARQTFNYKYRNPIEVLKMTSSAYGYRELVNPYTGGTRSSYHKGIDLVGWWHSLIRPISLNGEVIAKWYPPKNGRGGHKVHGGYVQIRHTDGWIESHSHLSSIYVKEGDKLIDGLFYRDGKLISAEGYIGRQGNTGLSEGEHLHLAIQDAYGNYVDPVYYIKIER